MPKKKQPRTIKAFVKHPDKAPCFEKISADLDAMQELVGGWLEEVKVSSDIVILCDEEGKLKGKVYNCSFGRYDLVGTIVFVGVKDNDWEDIPLSPDEFKEAFPALYKEV